MDAFSRSDDGPIAGNPIWYSLTFALVVFGVLFAMGTRNYENFRQLGITVAIACAIPFALMILRVVRLLQKIGRATLTTPHEYVPLGFTTTATYARPMREGVAAEAIEARLQCEERVTVGSGKNRRTVTTVVHDEELKPVVTPAMNELRVQIPIRVAENLPPTIWDKVAEVRWVVRMRLRMRGCSNTRSSFKIDVLPVVVKR